MLRKQLPNLLREVIDFNSQVPSQELALRGSRDGSVCTIDLSEASDRLSLVAVRCFFARHPKLMDYLERTRSRVIYDPILTKERHELRKFAPMGSAVTFIVQSMFFATVILATVMEHEGLLGRKHKNVVKRLRRRTHEIQVFGDDLAVPKDIARKVVRNLETVGLKVNSSKTHLDGFFRESCGVDAYRGYDVTPAYISHSVPQKPGISFCALIEQSNNAHRKGLWHLADELRKDLCRVNGMVPIANEKLGVASYFTFSRGTVCSKLRFDGDLGVWEVKGFALETRRRKSKRGNPTDILQWFIEGSRVDREIFTDPYSAGHVRVHELKLRARWVDCRSNWIPTKISRLAHYG